MNESDHPHLLSKYLNFEFMKLYYYYYIIIVVQVSLLLMLIDGLSSHHPIITFVVKSNNTLLLGEQEHLERVKMKSDNLVTWIQEQHGGVMNHLVWICLLQERY
jgi:hypothetical protein